MKVVVQCDDGSVVGEISLPNVDTWTDDWQCGAESEFAALVYAGIEVSTDDST